MISSTLNLLQVRRRDKDGRLKPLTLSARLSLLRAHGVHQVDREESAAIETIQVRLKTMDILPKARKGGRKDGYALRGLKFIQKISWLNIFIAMVSNLLWG